MATNNNKKKYQPLPEDYDEDPYFEETQKKSDENQWWLLGVAGLLGSAMVLNSINPIIDEKGAVSFPEVPKLINDIPKNDFNQIIEFKIEIKVDVSPVYSKEELNIFQHMSEQLKQLGRLEDPKTIENKWFEWSNRINDMTGQFGNNEAYKAGLIDTYISTEIIVLIPWITAGANTCDLCEEKASEGPYHPEDYPEPQHYGEECMPGDPVPLELETGK